MPVMLYWSSWSVIFMPVMMLWDNGRCSHTDWIQKPSLFGPVFLVLCPPLCVYTKGVAGSLLLCETHLLATAIIPSASPREFANTTTSAWRVSPHSKVHPFVPLGVQYGCAVEEFSPCLSVLETVSTLSRKSRKQDRVGIFQGRFFSWQKLS